MRRLAYALDRSFGESSRFTKVRLGEAFVAQDWLVLHRTFCDRPESLLDRSALMMRLSASEWVPQGSGGRAQRRQRLEYHGLISLKAVCGIGIVVAI